MKRILSTIIAFCAVSIVVYAGSNKQTQEMIDINNIYATTAIVTNLDYTNNIVTVETFSGVQYKFYGCEDWAIDDFCSMVMDTKGTTETVLDDNILKCRYAGTGTWNRWWNGLTF